MRWSAVTRSKPIKPIRFGFMREVATDSLVTGRDPRPVPSLDVPLARWNHFTAQLALESLRRDAIAPFERAPENIRAPEAYRSRDFIDRRVVRCEPSRRFRDPQLL